ncbi:MAG: amidohydrolase family protein [Planctomycetales bacterium]
MTSNRRDFCRRAAVFSAAALSSPVAFAAREAVAKDKPALIPIVDTHQHLWDLKKFRLPWLKTAPDKLKRSYTTKDYLPEIKGLDVASIYMEVNMAPELHDAEAEHLIRLSKSADHPTAAAVISGRPASDKFGKYIRRYKNTPQIKGIRQVLHPPETKTGLCLEKQFVSNIQLLGELNMSFDVCIRPTELEDAAKLADLCPDTRIILDHCGNADPKAFGKKKDANEETWHEEAPWRRGIEALSKRKNVICKISGVVARARESGWSADDLAPIVNHCLDAFSPDRVVFGSDWPVCLLRASLREWVDALTEIIANRSQADREKLWNGNARRHYSLTT